MSGKLPALVLVLSVFAPAARGAQLKDIAEAGGLNPDKIAAVPEPGAPAEAGGDIYKDYIRDAGLVSRGKVWKVANVRWSRGRNGKYHWDTAVIDPGLVEKVYWAQTQQGFGHAYIVFKFRPGGFRSLRAGAYASRYFVVSVESKLRKGEPWNPVAGAMGRYGISWILSTLETFIYNNVVENGIQSNLYQLVLPQEASRAVLKAALGKAVQDHGGELFNTMSNNCGINALSVINPYLPREKQVHATAPSSATRQFISNGLVDGVLEFPVSAPGGGVITPR